MKRFLTLAATLALGAAALTPLASHAQTGGYTTIQHGYDNSPRYEHPRHARRGFVWQPGHWERRGHHKVWIEGHWLRVRPGYGGGHRMAYERDSDRDGIPDSRDRDRDGDGISNRHDRRPDNPYR